MPRKLRGDWDEDGHYLGEDAQPDSEGDSDVRVRGAKDTLEGEDEPPFPDVLLELNEDED